MSAAIQKKISVPMSDAIVQAHGLGLSTWSLRVLFNYEDDLAGGKHNEYAAEIMPVLHVFTTHYLGILDPKINDNGIVVVRNTTLTQQQDGTAIQVEIPFNPAGLQIAKVIANQGMVVLPKSRLEEPVTAPQNGRWLLPADAYLTFNVYVETATESGQKARTHAGSARFLLQDVLAPNNNTEKVRAEWQVTGDAPLVKGFVDVHSVELVHRTSVTDAGTVMHPSKVLQFELLDGNKHAILSPEDATKEREAHIASTQKLLWDTVNSSLDISFADNAPIAVSIPAALKPVRTPYFTTDTGMTIVGALYATIISRVPAEIHFYQKKLKIALARADMDPSHLLLAVEAQKKSATLLPSTLTVHKLFMEMFMVYPNSMVYLSDFVNKGGRTLSVENNTADKPGVAIRLVHKNGKFEAEIVEDFKNPFWGNADDCEGLGYAGLVHYLDFRRIAASAFAELPNTPLTRLLQHMHEISQGNLYVPQLTLGMVTNKKLDVTVDTFNPDDVLAHSYFVLMPTAAFVSRLVDTSVTRGYSKAILSSKYVQGYQQQAWHKKLVMLIGEGTARSSPWNMPLATYYSADTVEAAVTRAEITLKAQSQIMQYLPLNYVSVQIPPKFLRDTDNMVAQNKVSTSNFYQANSAAFVPVFSDAAIFDVMYTQTAPATVAPSGLTHGILFNDFVRQNLPAAFKIAPYNMLSEEYMAIAQSVLAQIEPMSRINRTKEKVVAIETQALPVQLQAIRDLFGNKQCNPGASSQVLLNNASTMILPSGIVTLTLRKEDATETTLSEVYKAVKETRSLFESVTVNTEYLADAPVHGDEGSIPDAILYEIHLRVKQ